MNFFSADLVHNGHPEPIVIFDADGRIESQMQMSASFELTSSFGLVIRHRWSHSLDLSLLQSLLRFRDMHSDTGWALETISKIHVTDQIGDFSKKSIWSCRF